MTRRARRRAGGERATTQARRIGAEIKLGRATLAWSKRELARRAGVSTSTVGRIERGDPGEQLDTLVAMGAAVGIDLVVQAYPAAGVGLRDSGQLTIAQLLCQPASQRWRPGIEVPAGRFGRSADLVLFGPDEILHIEIERAVVDFQAQYRSALGKRDVLAAAHTRPVRLILAIEGTERNRNAMRPHLSVVSRQLPATSRQIMAAIRGGRALGKDGLLWVRRRPPG